MSNLQITLGIVGVLFIVAIIGHGLWTMRKNSQQIKTQSRNVAKKRTAAQNGGFDDDGIGSVRVVKRTAEEASEASSAVNKSSKATTSRHGDADTAAEQMSMNLDVEDAEQAPLPSMRVDREESPSTVTASASQTELDLPSDEQSTSSAESESEQEPATAAPAESESPAEPQPESQPETEADTAASSTVADDQPQPAEEVISLFVKGNVQGAVLLQMMTELGCKFGDMGIFHRFEQTSGNGPMIFSVANMFNPGTFDLDNIENFETDGVALFMTLPLNYDGQQAFNMMLNAAKKLAMEIPQGQVLDGQRQLLSRQSIQHAHQRIREFEKPSS